MVHNWFMLRGFLVAWLTLAVQGELLLHRPICEVASLEDAYPPRSYFGHRPNCYVASVENNMVTMDMGTDRAQAKLQDDGSYLAHVQFTMSGPWQVSVLITVPGAQTVSATFEVTAQ